MHAPILAPVVALVLWSLVMWLWLYATRIPAIRAARLKLDPTRTPADLAAALPAKARWPADNYNHLMEQPTLFYAITFTLALVGGGSGKTAGLAWLYVLLRVAHSLVQATVNIIMIRFALFTLSSLVLLAMAIKAALLVL